MSRSRASQFIPTTRNNINTCHRFFCTNSPPPLPSSGAAADTPLSSQSDGQPSSTQKKQGWNTLVKLLLGGSLLGVAAAGGYASYAYTLDEVDKKTRTLRDSAHYTVGDNAPAIDKFQAMLSTAALTVPAKSIELYLDLRRAIEEQVRGFTEPSSDALLPDLHPLQQNVFILVLDLNETLVYSDWKRDRGWRTFKRPGVEAFLEHLAQFYEIVVYSDQQSMYVDPVVERLDEKHCIQYRLSRSATRYQDGKHYRDLSKLNRDPAKIIYVSGRCQESCLQPENCIQVNPWKSDVVNDTALLDLIPFLEYVARTRPADIRKVLASYQGCDIAKGFIQRSKEHQKRRQEQKQHGRFWQR